MRPDYLIANSKYTQARIKKYYRRESQVIYPPVRVKDFKVTGKNQNYFLTVARLSAYKQIDILIEAFGKLGLPLVIVGDGSQRKKLEKKIVETQNSNRIKILGELERSKLIKLYENCRAFVFACEDDFGIAPVEAMAAGKPVIALREGGVTETVLEGETGEFFDTAKPEMIADGIRRFIENEKKYNPEEIRQRAEEFREDRFERELTYFINKIR
jgi:glycosyltransferase involved in cell wall biosynthesis